MRFDERGLKNYLEEARNQIKDALDNKIPKAPDIKAAFRKFHEQTPFGRYLLAMGHNPPAGAAHFVNDISDILPPGTKSITAEDAYQAFLKRPNRHVDDWTPERFAQALDDAVQKGLLPDIEVGITVPGSPSGLKRSSFSSTAAKTPPEPMRQGQAAGVPGWLQYRSAPGSQTYVTELRRTVSAAGDAPLGSSLATGELRAALSEARDALLKAEQGHITRPETIKRLKRLVPHIGEQLEAAMGVTKDTVSKERYRLLVDMREKTKELLERTRTETKEAIDDIRYKRKEKMFPATGEAVVKGDPRRGVGLGFEQSLKGHFFTPEQVKIIEKQLGIQDRGLPGKLSGAAAAGGDVLRFTTAGFDMGTQFVLGLATLGRNPATWARATGHSFAAFFRDASMHQKYLAQNISAGFDAVQHGVAFSGGGTDYFSAIQRGAPIPTAVSKVPVAGEALLNVAGRFERSFTSFGDYSRMEWWKAMRDTAAKEGDKGLNELASVINSATGAFQPGALGIPQGQQEVERAWLFFSPRYTRASMGLLADFFQGGLRGREAKLALARMAFTGMSVYYGAARALGQEPNLDPRDSRFLALKIGDTWVGPGSFWKSMVRLMVDVPDTLVSDPGAFLTLSTRDNPIVRWFRSRTSPVTSTAWEIVTGHDYLGNELESPVDWAKMGVSRVLPFSLEASIMAEDYLPVTPGDRLARGATSFIGLNSFPVSLGDRRNMLREQYAQAAYSKPWDELNRLQRLRLENANEDLRMMTAGVRAQRVLRGEEIDLLVDEFYKDRDLAMSEWHTKVDAAIAAVKSGDKDLPYLRKTVLPKANEQRRGAMELLNKNPKYDKVKEYFANIHGLGSPERPEDFAYNQYVTLIIDPKHETTEGVPDYKSLQADIDVFKARWGDEVMSYIQARFDEGQDLPPLVQEYYRGLQKYRYYWDDSVREVFNARQDGATLSLLYEQYERATELEQEELLKEFPSLNNAIKTISRVRSRLRELNPGLDAFMFRWGYASTLSAKANGFEDAKSFWRRPDAMSDYAVLAQEQHLASK